MSNLENVVKVSKKFKNLDEVKTELKRIQSIKCRLKKQKGRKSYSIEMTKVLQQEQLIKEVRDYISPKKVTTTTMNENDIKILNYDETIKAIKSIQSKKCLSKWLTDTENDNDEYKNAERIEQQLLDHKKEVEPLDPTFLRKSQLATIIDSLENVVDIDKNDIIQQLKKIL